MLRQNQLVKIFEGNSTDLKFNITVITEATITSKRDEYTDTAVITFPNNLNRRSEAIDNIKIGDRIEVFLGYFPKLTKIFSGFINYVNKNSPLVINCEDDSFLLKRQALPARNFPNATIAQVINTFFTGPVNIVDTSLGGVRINKGATLIQFLDLLKTKYGILSFFQDGVLNINSSLTDNNRARTFLIDEQRNVPMGSTSLDFQKNDDLPIVSHGISTQEGGGKIELFATYEDNVLNNNIIVSTEQPLGTLNTLKVPNVSREQLENLIRNRLPLLFYTGVTGDVTTFGEPVIKHGDTVQYVDSRVPERNGFYRVNSVVTTFSTSGGYRQVLTLGVQVR